MLDRLSYRALNLQDVMSNIEYYSELGRKKRLENRFWKCGEEDNLKKYFQELNQIIKLIEGDIIIQDKLKGELMHVKDISYSIDRLGKEIEIHELFEIKQFCYFYERIRSSIVKSSYGAAEAFPSLEEVFTILDPEKTHTPTFKISSVYSDRLYDIRKELADVSRAKKLKQAEFKHKINLELSLPKLEDKVIVSKYNSSLRNKLENSHYFYIQEENFANIIYAIKYPENIGLYDSKLHDLIVAQEKACDDVLIFLSNKLEKYIDKLALAVKKIANFDDMLGKAIFSLKYNCCLPKVTDNDIVNINEAVNIPVFNSLKENKIVYEKIDILFDNKMNILVGANMAGKSTALTTFGQISYLVQHGFPIPANKCEIPLFDFIVVTGDETNHKSIDLSSFGKEVVRINKYLDKSGKGLYLIDEFARGTNPEEGNALSRALLEYLQNRDIFCFCATHFNSPLYIENVGHYVIPGINADDFNEIRRKNQDRPENRLRELHNYMKYNMIKVSGQKEAPRAGIMIAELLGMKNDIVDRAKKLL